MNYQQRHFRRNFVRMNFRRFWLFWAEQRADVRPEYSLRDTILILYQPWNLLLRRRKHSTDHLICGLINKANCLWGILGLREVFLIRHTKWSILYLLCWSRRLRGCYEIKLASQRLYTCLTASKVMRTAAAAAATNDNSIPPPPRFADDGESFPTRTTGDRHSESALL